MTPFHERVPDLLTWSTQSDHKSDLDGIKDQVGPDAKMASDIDKHVAFSDRCKDAKVLKQD